MHTSTRLRRLLTAVLALAVMAPAMAFAQGLTITGKVISGIDGQPLLGANVTIEALQISVGTNASGQYTIPVPGARVSGQQVTLKVRAIGFTVQSKAITLSAGNQTYNFELKEDINRLSQVVVTGVTAGTEQRKLPFTVAQVTEKDMPVPGSNPFSQLAGKVPGANIVSNSGQPGTVPSIVLRGPQSINASGRDQGPLVIVDGVVQQGSLADIDPTSIENIEVVKGAAAASLYGSRAGRGVINITSKSGKIGQEGIKFNVRAEGGASDIENKIPLSKATGLLMNETRDRFCIAASGAQNCSRSVDIYAEALRINEGGGDWALSPSTFSNDAGIASNLGTIKLRGLYQVTRFPTTFDPVAQFITSGPWMGGNVDMTGKYGRANFFASLGSLRETGSIRFLDGYRRNNVRLNVDNTLPGNWTTSIRAYYARVGVDNNGSNFSRMSRQPGFADLLRTDKYGRLFVRSNPLAQGAQNENPLLSNKFNPQLGDNNRFTGSVTARWQPLTWVDGEFAFGYDNQTYTNRSIYDRGYRISTSTQSTSNLGGIGFSDGYNQAYNASMNWTARRDLFRELAARFTIRTQYEQQDNRGDSQSGVNLVVPGLYTSAAVVPSTSTSISSTQSSIRQMGGAVGVNLDYKDRYTVETLVRRDGASLFGSEQRWKTYARVSGLWRISEEKFWGGKLKDVVNELKFRASAGQAGNRPSFSQQYETFSVGGGSVSASALGNRNLKPEVATEVEIGFDAEILNKFGLTITKARSIVADQILLVPPPAASGFTSQWKNAGQLENNTWEASLNMPIIERRNFQYSVRLNYDATTSKITGLQSSVAPYYYTASGQQGTETMFYVAPNVNFGTIYGRRFVNNCSQLPASFQSRCGDGKEWQKNDMGFIVWTGAGNSTKDGITKNLWQAVLGANQSPFNYAEIWGMPIIMRDSTGIAVTNNKNGSALPDYRWSFSQNLTYKRLSMYAILDATRGANVFNLQRAWSFGDFQNKEQDQFNKTVETAKPMGYYYRVGLPDNSGVGGLYDVLGSNSYVVEDGSFIKLREVTIGYRIGAIAGRGDWTVSLIGRNLKTWSNYKGYDPETGLSGGTNGSGAINAVDAYNFPNLRAFTFQLTTSF